MTKPSPAELARRAGLGVGLGLVDATATAATSPLDAPPAWIAASLVAWGLAGLAVAPHQRDGIAHAWVLGLWSLAWLALAPFLATPTWAAGCAVALGIGASMVPVPGRGAPVPLGFAAVALAVRTLGSAPAPPPGDGPDILLVTLDTWRADSRSGSAAALAPDLTPFLDGLASSGCAPAPAFSTSPLTGPSHGALLTGRHPLELGVLLNGRPLPAHRGLPAILRDAGYRTEAYVSSAMLAGSLGYARDFDRYDDDLDGLADLRRTALGPLVPPADPGRAFERPGRDTLTRAERSQSRDDRPLFAWVHLYDPHRPYQPSAEALARVPATLPLPPASVYDIHPVGPPPVAGPAAAQIVALQLELFGRAAAMGDRDRRDAAGRAAAAHYLAEVADADALVARAFAWFEARTGHPPEVWAVVGDHGESLTEHHELGGHQRHLYRANTEVPLLMSPGGCPDGPVSTVGLADALVERAGLGPAAAWDAPVLSAVLGPAHGAGVQPLVRKVMLRHGDREVLVTLPPDGRTVETYDLGRDPHERHPLPRDPGLEAAIRPWEDAIRGAGPGEVDPGLREALEALGYVQ